MKRVFKLTATIVLVACVGGLAACSRAVIPGLSAVTATVPAPPTLPPPTAVPPTDTPLPAPTDTAVPATDTPAAPPTQPTLAITVTQAALPTLAVTAASSGQALKIYLIAVNDNGKAGPKVGCGDSAVAVTVLVKPTKSVLRASLDALLANKQQNYGESGLYNALYQSNLQVQSLSLSGGKATVYLTGTLLLGGECDNPRVQAQLEQTVMQFSTVKQAAIYINGKTLAEALSLK